MLAENLIESELFGHEKGAFTGATDLRIGWFEMAQGGTLFLDEIGNLPSAVQAKLLRVLQERRMERVGGRDTIKLDVRVVAATNVNLKDGIAAGSFRTDLYYRLQEMTICLPPLRERRGDLRPIARHFVTVYAERFASGVRDISDDALEMLEAHHWPGNVRELENAIKSSVVLATDVVRPEHLPPDLRIQPTGGAVSPVSSEADDEQLKLEIEIALRRSRIDLKALGAKVSEQAERQVLAALLRRRRMSGAQLAKLLGVDPKTLRTKLRKYGLERGRNDLAAAG
jgi:DNA-binding NtrC family response regulator